MARRQRKKDLAQRRTAAAQERMRLISQLARKDKKDDNFGSRDEDWDVYKAINKVRNFKLIQIEKIVFFAVNALKLFRMRVHRTAKRKTND